MKKILATLLVLVMGVAAQAGDLAFINFVPTDTIVGTGVDTVYLSGRDARINEFTCGPFYLWSQVVEIDSQSMVTVYIDWSINPTRYGYTTIDSILFASNTTAVGETLQSYDTLAIGTYEGAPWYRVRVVGGADNDTAVAAGSIVTIDGLGRGCK